MANSYTEGGYYLNSSHYTVVPSYVAVLFRRLVFTSMAQNPVAVLAVDDNEYNRDLLSRHLRREGYVVSVAEDGVEALAMMRAQKFDLVLLDLMMPNMDGFQVLETLQGDSDLSAIPVIVISAVTDTDKLIKCLSLGAQDYLFKPLHPEYLKARIRACLEKRLMA
jgi:adenylate cyclase